MENFEKDICVSKAKLFLQNAFKVLDISGSNWFGEK